MNGYGERCGNANLCTVIANLELKLGKRCLPEGSLGTLAETSRFVAEVANLPPDDHAPYVGHSAFAHKGGVHVAAMRRNAASYQHIDPKLVGNQCRVVVSELSGRGNVLSKAEELDIDIDAGAETDVLATIKAAEARGFSFEAAEGSVALLIRRQDKDYVPPFRIVDWKVLSTPTGSEAMLKVRVGERLVHTAADGHGPVSALDAALRKALAPELPHAATIQLHDYKVRILDGRLGTAAVTRVLVTSGDGERTFCTVGASASILEASLAALADGFELGLTRGSKGGLTHPERHGEAAARIIEEKEEKSA
jgi:2-isopropylmalate synthase